MNKKLEFCNYISASTGYCGLIATEPNGRCKKHLNKEIIIKPVGKRFRGDSKYQTEMGYGKNKEGSNV